MESYQLDTMNAYNNRNTLFRAIKFDRLDDIADIRNISNDKMVYFYIYRNIQDTDLLDYYIIEEYQDYIIVDVDSNNIVLTGHLMY